MSDTAKLATATTVTPTNNPTSASDGLMQPQVEPTPTVGPNTIAVPVPVQAEIGNTVAHRVDQTDLNTSKR